MVDEVTSFEEIHISQRKYNLSGNDKREINGGLIYDTHENPLACIERKDKICLSYDDSIRQLFPLLAGNVRRTPALIDSFSKLLKFSFPFLRSKDPSAYVVARILSEAQQLNVPLHVVDRYLDVCHDLVTENRSLGKDGLFNDKAKSLENKLFLFVTHLIEIAELKYSNLDLNDDDDDYLNEPSIANSISIEDMIEVDLHRGFLKKQHYVESLHYVSSDGDGTNEYDDERQSVSSDVNKSNNNRSNNPNQMPVKKNETNANGLDDDIDEFWKQRQRTRIEKEEEKRTRSTRIRPSSSIEGPGIGKSKSLFTLSVQSRSNLDISSKSDDSDDNTKLSSHRKPNIPNHGRDDKRGVYDTRGNDIHHSISADKGVFTRFQNHVWQFPKVWQQSYVERTKNHQGYFDIDIHSLYESALIYSTGHELDNKPWEHRTVKQRFLDEQSLSFSRNWFGSFSFVHGNELIAEPVCKVKSMEMPVKTEEWRNSWYKPESSTPLPSNISDSSRIVSEQYHKKYGVSQSRSSISKNSGYDDFSWEDIPECGTFKNVKQKPGERISRVTPDLTSYLRRSRWRKKHFPAGSCPYK